MNIQKQNFLEQQLILKEIEMEAYEKMNANMPGDKTWDIKAEGFLGMQIIIMKQQIDALKKENFPKGICNFCGTTLKDGNFVFSEKSPFSYCNKGCMKLHADMILKKAEKNG